jgi:hypothetical protein
MKVNEMMIPTPDHQPWSHQFLALDPSSSLVAYDIPALQQTSQEMLGRHYEFECGFVSEEAAGAIATDTGDTEEAQTLAA